MKRHTLLFFIVLFISVPYVLAQKEDESLKELFLDAEFFFLNEDYEEALSNYQIVFKRGYEENGNINYRIGQCYLNISGEKDKAIPYLEMAVQYANSNYQEGLLREKYTPFDSYFYLGNAYRINNDFVKAKASYEQFKTFYTKKDKERLALADKEIEACDFAEMQMQKSVEVRKVNLGRPVSTNSRDIFPVSSGDLNSLVYVSKQKFYDALFYCRKVNNEWSTPVNITPEVQSDGDQYPTFLSYDGKELYLRQEDNFDADLLVSKNVDGVWTKSLSLGKNINTKYWEGNASVTKDGKTLYFSSNRKDGAGAMDIYKSAMQPDGQWGTPVNLGSKVNTIFNEDAPYITEDGSRLYFISQGQKTMGGYDIFYCNVLPDGHFSDAVHLDYPINTTDDDLYFYPVKNGAIAYTASSQKGNIGFEDIFALYLTPNAENLANIPIATVPDKGIETISSAGLVKIPSDSAAGNSVLAVAEQPKKAEDLEKAEPAKKIDDEAIVLNTIFFDFNSLVLDENAKKKLDYLVIVLKNYDDLKLQFTGHADALGTSQYNQVLSEKRAKSAKDYLVRRGVPSNKISVNGMGEQAFVAINKNKDGSDNPEGRKFNRRVDIRVLEKKPERKIVIEELDIPKPIKI